MPEKQIRDHLVIDWKNGNTRTRSTEPKATDLGTNEIATEIAVDVVIPEPEIESLTARVEVPAPRVTESEAQDVDSEDVTDWQDVADEVIENEMLGPEDRGHVDDAEAIDHYTLEVLKRSPDRPPVDDVEAYVRDGFFAGQAADAE